MNIKRFIVTLILLAIAIVCFDFIIGEMLRKAYFSQSKGKLFNVTYAMEKQTSDVLIFGSSRAMHHYNPKIISDSLNLSCYNVGFDGQSILYHKAVLDVITERYLPKIILLDVNSYEFDVKPEAYDLLNVLNPYVKLYPVLWNTLSLKSDFERIKHLSSIYPYNSMFSRILMGNLKLGTRDMSDDGFTPQSGVWNDSLKTISYEKCNLDINKVIAFKNFIWICKKKNINLYVIYSPSFCYYTNQSTTLKKINEICQFEKINFINYTNDSKFMKNELFHDPSHLNAKGAKVFSEDISKKIKTMYNKY